LKKTRKKDRLPPDKKTHPPRETGEKGTRPKKGALRENIEAIAVAIVLALFIRTFIIQAFKIPSGSMKETLQIGDHILVNKFIYGVKLPFINATLLPVKTPQRGDIVVFEFPEDPDKDFIKRVVGVAGDVIEGKQKRIFVNHKPAIRNGFQVIHTDATVIPANRQPRDTFGPVTVPPNALFVMGDNRDQSYDSRFWGFVDLKAVKGKAFMIYWSWDKKRVQDALDWLMWWKAVRWNRFGMLIK
jgi:signal peptidase I